MTEEEKRSLKIRLGRRLSSDRAEVMEIVIEEINKTKTTLPDERPKGEWKIEMDVYCICSECNNKEVKFSNFCPNCGADMRGDKHDE